MPKPATAVFTECFEMGPLGSVTFSSHLGSPRADTPRGREVPGSCSGVTELLPQQQTSSAENSSPPSVVQSFNASLSIRSTS